MTVPLMKPNTEIKDRFHIAEDKKESILPKTGKKKTRKRQNADDYAINM